MMKLKWVIAAISAAIPCVALAQGMFGGNGLVGGWFPPGTPTISSGFCTSPSIVSTNGAFTFTFNVGSACATGTGVIGLPTAPHGWVCTLVDLTDAASDQPTMTANSVSSVTVSNYSRTTGLAANFASSEVLGAICSPY